MVIYKIYEGVARLNLMRGQLKSESKGKNQSSALKVANYGEAEKGFLV